jgi:hypothetical protein
MSCCNNTYNLGCYCHCDTISFGIVPQSGTYKFVFTFAGIKRMFSVTAVQDEPFEFDLSLLNENASYTFYVLYDNIKVPIIINDSEQTDFRLKTENIQGCGGEVVECTLDYVVCDYWSDDYSV